LKLLAIVEKKSRLSSSSALDGKAILYKIFAIRLPSSTLPFDLGSGVVGTTDGFRVGLERWEMSLLLVFGKKVADDHM